MLETGRLSCRRSETDPGVLQNHEITLSFTLPEAKISHRRGRKDYNVIYLHWRTYDTHDTVLQS